MNKNTVTKVIKGTAIVGVVWATAELFFQLGKGDILGVMKKYDMSAEEAYEIISDRIKSDDSFALRQRFKLIKSMADFNTRDQG